MGHFLGIDGTGRMFRAGRAKGECAMSTVNQNDLRELSAGDLAAVTGGGYIQFASGFGTRTDAAIAQKQLMESNYRGAIETPTIRL